MKIFTGILVSLLCVSLCCAGEVDVFELSKRGTPSQLKEALKAGAVFNVSRDYDASNDDAENDEESLFSWGETPLHLAAAYNHNPDSVKFLISQGLDVNAEGENGLGISGTPLSCAMWHDNYKAAKVLLEAGADPNYWSMVWFFCGTAFHDVALITESSADIRFMIEALTKAGGNINVHEEFDSEERQEFIDDLKAGGYDSLTLADGKINPEDPFNIGDLRLSRGGILSAESSCTPLIYAVLYDNPDAVNILLDYGADANIRSIEGMTAFDYAKHLPKDSKLRKSPAYQKLKKATRN
ncbi:MAG: ankyrin repeat domain-containing protein [Synergistaceae bacterium]|nr:ankyrin repeat domain-containing protein [Synergistaceae bacterium]